MTSRFSRRVLSRRRFLAASLAGAAAHISPWRCLLGGSTARLLADQTPHLSDPPGRRIGTVELEGPSAQPRPRFNTLLGSGLDARLFTDLSALAPDTLITPADRFYVRTEFPATLRRTTPWTIQFGGLVHEPRPIALDSLRGLVGPRGAHLLECAGNSDRGAFGLISAAEWEGIPMAALLEHIQPLLPSLRVLVSGVDDHVHPSQTSVPGASWVFSRDQLERSNAFLATGMNGAELTRDHGFPVRLIVPGWYGCACIKWVDRIDIVPDAARATSQMHEFAARTHQSGDPELARDFAPAVIDAAAMPVRIEKWLVDDRITYRVVGIVWGGSRPTNALEIRFRPDDPFVPVTDCPLPKTTSTWSLWSHLWRPSAPRRYQIVLRVGDPSVRTRRLDMFYYTRAVTIDEV